MSIKWGNVDFNGPYSIALWDPPYRAALYAIMIKPDQYNKPETYQIIYFGESSNLSERGFYSSHHKYNCWVEQAGSLSNLYIGIHAMPNSTKDERTKLETALIAKFKPACND